MQWILEEIGLIQIDPTTICADNQGVIHMANAQKPTHRMRHVEIKIFVFLQWSNDDLINFMETPTKNIHSDSLSKVTDRTKFYEHMDVLIGRQKPQYTNTEQTKIIHYICTGGDLKYSPTHNSLYDLVTNSHEYVSTKSIFFST